MARSAAVRVEGLAPLLRQLQALGVSADDLKEAFGEISEDVATEAATRVRVDSGDTRASIRPARTKNKAVVRAGSAKVPYAGVLNYVRPGDEFLTGPANENPEQKVAKIEANLDRLIVSHGLR